LDRRSEQVVSFRDRLTHADADAQSDGTLGTLVAASQRTLHVYGGLDRA
jgi:hypothetical protein